ncbi:MAG: DUF4838 domain-containing protein [Clostridia bacterium]|nr:DUF4838 domain-containing protein [Clostridia bacterium]
MFKRIVGLSLTAAIAIGALASCSVDEISTIDPALTVTSSAAEDYALWLSDRLDTIPDDVIVGVGDEESYGVSMENFEDDGYVIKKVGDSVAIFGKTGEGLDRGVRKYANMVELDGEVSDVVYHEGYRIEKFELFGHDISEFVIEYPAQNNANMTFAVSELIQLVKKACGAELTAVEGTADAEHKIIFRHTDDPVLEDDGYRYFEENGCLVIEGAVARGCMYGVYRFLQNECGWQGLTYGDSYLEESDYIGIPEGINKSEVPAFEYFIAYKNRLAMNAYVTDRTEIKDDSAENSYGYYKHASHGMNNRKWANRPVANWSMQVCHSSDSMYDLVYGNVMKYLAEREAEGHIIGETFKNIDIAQGDNNNYCMCAGCVEVLAEELSNSGAVLRFANRLAEDVNSVYDGVAIHIFAYFSTKIPPAVTTAHDMVYITFAQNGNCSNHPMDGSLCGEQGTVDRFDYLVTCNNKDNHEWLSGWCAIAKNVTVWYYNLNTQLLQYTLLDIICADMQYMAELGVRGVFVEAEYDEYGIKRVEHQIYEELNWQIDITEEGYQQLIRDMLAREYGSYSVDYLMVHLDYWYEALNRVGCTDCWGMSNSSCPMFDVFYVRDHSDMFKEIMDKTVAYAENSRQEFRAKLLSCHVYYQDVYTKYFKAYEENDTELLAELSDTYDFLVNRIIELGIDPSAHGSKKNKKINLTLEEEAWKVWKDWRSAHVGSDYSRPAPDWVTAKPEVTMEVTTVVPTDEPAETVTSEKPVTNKPSSGNSGLDVTEIVSIDVSVEDDF